MWNCIKRSLANHFSTLGWWLLSVLIACIAVGLVGAAAGGVAGIGIVLAACAVIVGFSIGAFVQTTIARLLWDCA